MTRSRRVIAVAVAASIAVTVAAHAAPPGSATTPGGGHGTVTHGSYTLDGVGSRDYLLYRPADATPRSLVVFLHGCNVDAALTEQVTRFDALADREHFAVLYPQQTVTQNSSAPFADGNGIGCWNWFLPQDQSRGAGEPAILAGMTQSVVQSQAIDPGRVYVDGISAGADMAVILGADYPDVFASVTEIAGCAYATCSDVTGAVTNQAMGKHARVVPLFAINGSADSLNNMAMAGTLVSSWLGADDLADDGAMNGSVPRTPASERNYGFDQTPQPGSGDVCIHNDSLTCPGGAVGFQGSYPYTALSYDDAHGCDVLDFWVVHGMEHAYPDAPGDQPYTDPLGPDATTAAWNFFAAHPMTSSNASGCGRRAPEATS